MSPVVRLAVEVSDRHHYDFGIAERIDKAIGEARKTVPSSTVAKFRPSVGMQRNGLTGSLNLVHELFLQAR